MQYSERFRETYCVYNDSNLTTENIISIAEKEQAMDFFHGLDQAKYGMFKTSMLNGWATGAIKLPEMVNEMYWIASS